MGDLNWTHRRYWTYPLDALRYHCVVLGASGSGKTETLLRLAYGARKAYGLQVIYLDAKGETKREEEQGEDNAAKFVAVMRAAGAQNIGVFPSLSYQGWLGSPLELKNRLLSIIDTSESAYYGDVASHVVDLALSGPDTPRSSGQFLRNLNVDQLKGIYKNQPTQYRRVLALDKALVEQVAMRYQVFFSAVGSQLDGTLNYRDLDAAYLRIRGFTLRNEAPRLGRFFVADFMHYIAERKQPGVQTLLIIDEFNALKMREETSILFEQARSFGAALIISAQGYAGLGPREYSNRVLDAASTYVLHACSDPYEVSKRAGKKLRIQTTWSEKDEDPSTNRSVRSLWDWKIREDDIIRQSTGQAYWIYRGKTQQVQTARVPISQDQVMAAWSEIRRQEDIQRSLDSQQSAPAARPTPPLVIDQEIIEKAKLLDEALLEAEARAPTWKRQPTKKKATTPPPQRVQQLPLPVKPPVPPVASSDDDDEPDRL